jgi:hypothetical protein
MLDLLGIIRTRHIHQVRGIFGNGPVITQFLDHRNIMFHTHELHVTVLDLAAAEPDIHYREQHAAHDQGNITAMQEFLQVGDQERNFYDQVYVRYR